MNALRFGVQAAGLVAGFFILFIGTVAAFVWAQHAVGEWLAIVVAVAGAVVMMTFLVLVLTRWDPTR